MKKSFLFMAFTSLVLVSCVNDDENGIYQDSEMPKVSFDFPVMYNNGETRAAYHEEITSGQKSYPAAEEFIVYGWQHATSGFTSWTNSNGSLFMSNITVRYNGASSWEPYPDEFTWPMNSAVTFAAYSPAVLTDAADTGHEAPTSINYDDNGLTVEDFLIPGLGYQYDFMFSKRSFNRVSSNHMAGGYTGVPIEFQHALSSIHFALANFGSEEVVLKSIELSNVYNTGTFNENINSNSGSSYVRGDNVNPTWSLTASSDNRTNYTFYNPSEGIIFPNSLTLMHDITGVEHLTLLLMPQDFKNTTLFAGTSELPDAQITINYTKNGTPQSPHTVLLKDLFDGKWEMGKRYIYIIAIGGTNKIYFAPSVEAWETVDSDNQTIQLP